MSQSSISDTSNYRMVCKEAAEDDAKFASFKKNPTYNAILEHLEAVYVPELCAAILENKLDLSKLSVLKTNDERGSATLVDAGCPFGKVSPSTLRYMKVLSDINKLFGDQSKSTIVEVGVGYGGQCKLFNDYYPPTEYHLIDLREAIQLSKRYLRKYGYNNIKYYSFDDELEDLERYHLFISNYAFTEVTRAVQELYLEKFILKSNHGYMICNFICSEFFVDSMTREELLSAIPNCKEMIERPLTHPRNRVLYW